MTQDWDIKPRGDRCHACEQPFRDRQTYTSALIFGEEGYARRDHCDECWQKIEAESAPYSVWQGVFRMPPPPEAEAMQKETVESLLRKLMEAEDDSSLNVIYILAVMLERKRILVEKDVQTTDDARTIRVYEHRQTNEVFLVPDPHLRLDELGPVQQQVIDMLGSDKKEAAEEDEVEEVPTADSIDTGATCNGLKAGFYSKTD